MVCWSLRGGWGSSIPVHQHLLLQLQSKAQAEGSASPRASSLPEQPLKARVVNSNARSDFDVYGSPRFTKNWSGKRNRKIFLKCLPLLPFDMCQSCLPIYWLNRWVLTCLSLQHFPQLLTWVFIFFSMPTAHQASHYKLGDWDLKSCTQSFFFFFFFFLNNTFVLLHSIDQSATPQNRSKTILWDLFHAAGVPGMLTTGLSDKLWFLMTPQLKCFLHKGRWLSPTVRQRYCPHGCFKGSLALTFSTGSFLPVKEKRSLVQSELPYHVWVHTIELKDKHSS